MRTLLLGKDKIISFKIFKKIGPFVFSKIGLLSLIDFRFTIDNFVDRLIFGVLYILF